MSASFFFKLAGLLFKSGQAAAALGDLIPLQSTLVPLVEGSGSWATVVDGIAASDAATIQAEADAICSLIQISAKMLINPATKAEAAALLKSIPPTK